MQVHVVKDPQLADDHPILPVQDFSMAQVSNKLEMARVRQTVAKEVKVLDISKANKIKVGFILTFNFQASQKCPELVTPLSTA